jgi:hypothetical protein
MFSYDSFVSAAEARDIEGFLTVKEDGFQT